LANHYEVLGVSRSATEREIKAAFRKIVLEHHPDVSPTTDSRAKFRQASDAHAVLLDPIARRAYDEYLDSIYDRFKVEQAKAAQEAKQQTTARAAAVADPDATKAEISELLRRLSQSFSRGNAKEAEELARQVLAKSVRQPVAHAILGDLARGRGDLNEAARRYAYAAQFEPSNPVYQKRYEELLLSSTIITQHDAYNFAPLEASRKALIGGLSVVLVFVALSFLSTGPNRAGAWIGAYVVSGVVLGATASAGNWLDKLSVILRSASGRPGVGAMLLLVLAINAWLGMAAYGLLFLAQRSQVNSLTLASFGLGLMALLFGASAATTQTFDWLVATFLVTLPGGFAFVFGWQLGDWLRSLPSERV
jgi:hypothetical protein